MKKTFTFILIITFFNSIAQEKVQQEFRPVGVGIRIGDFNGITFKYYLEDMGICLEANIGRSYFSGDNYERRFEVYASENDILFVKYDPEKTIEKQSIGYRIDIQKYGKIGRTPHYYWYAGTGFQARTFTLEHNYSYQLKVKNSTAIRVNDGGQAVVKHKSFGINLVLGAEYVFQEVPISVFVDGLLFYEAFGIRGNIIGQFGLGSRFVF